MTDPGQPEPGDQGLVEYIRANRDRYNREVLTNMLIREGHAPGDVAEAWRVADEDRATEQAEQGLEPRRARQTVLTVVALLLALAAFFIGEFAILAASGGRPMMLLYLVLFPIQIAYVTGWIVRQIRASDGLRRGDAAMTVGWLITPVIALLAIMGVCYGYGAQFGCILEC